MISWRARIAGVEHLNDSLAAAFEAFDTSTLEGAVAAALAGEYYGERTFRIFATEPVGRDERQFWELSREIEGLTILCLEEFAREAGIVRPDCAPFRELAIETARVFSGEPHEEYCRWVAPLIAQALASFTALRTKLHDVAPEVGQQVLDHEYAFACAWQLLPEGFLKASAPLVAHLERYGSSGSG